MTTFIAEVAMHVTPSTTPSHRLRFITTAVRLAISWLRGRNGEKSDALLNGINWQTWVGLCGRNCFAKPSKLPKKVAWLISAG